MDRHPSPLAPAAPIAYIRVCRIRHRLAQLHARHAEAKEMIERGQCLKAEVEAEISAGELELEEAVMAPIEGGDGPTSWLPNELMILILLQLGDVRACVGVCRQWHRLCVDRQVRERPWTLRWQSYADGTLTPTRLEGHERDICALVVGNEGKVYSASRDRTIKVWSSKDGSCIRSLTGHTDWVRALTIGPDGNLYSASDDSTVRVWNGNTGSHMGTFEVNGSGWALAVGERWLYASSFNNIAVCRHSNGDRETTMRGHVEDVNSLVLGNDNLYSGSQDKTIRVWSASEFTHLRTLKGHSAGVLALVLDRNGTLFSGSSDQTIRVWSDDGEEARVLRGHIYWVRSLVVSPTGTLFSGSSDGTLRVWHPGQGDHLVLCREAATVRALALGPDDRLFSGYYGGSLFSW